MEDTMNQNIENGSLFKQPDFWVNIGHAATRKQDFKKAILAFDAALKLDPGNPRIIFDLAFAYAEDGHDEKAAELFEQADQVLQSDSKFKSLVAEEAAAEQLGRTDDMSSVRLEPVLLAASRIVDQPLSAWDRPLNIACADMDVEASFVFSLKNSRIFAALADQSTVDCVQIRTSDGRKVFLTKGAPQQPVCYAESIGLNSFSSSDEICQLMASYLSVKTNHPALHEIVLSQLAFFVPLYQTQGMLADNKAVLEDSPVVAEIDLELTLGINSHTLKELLPWAKKTLYIKRGTNFGKKNTVPYTASIGLETEVVLSHGVIEITLYSGSDPLNRAQVRLTANHPQELIFSEKGLPFDWNDIRVALTLKE